MTDPQFPDEYYMTVEELLADYERADFPAVDDETLVCDFCSLEVPFAEEPRVGHYLTDRLIHTFDQKSRYVNRERMLAPMATYCTDCATQRLFFPAKGYTEVRMFFTIDSDLIMRDPEITDVSPEDDGIPWDPVEVATAITQVPIEQMVALGQQGGEDVYYGPENVVTFFMSIGSGIDIRELVNWKGEIDDQLLGQARRRFLEIGDEDRETFSSRVRGEE